MTGTRHLDPVARVVLRELRAAPDVEFLDQVYRHAPFLRLGTGNVDRAIAALLDAGLASTDGTRISVVPRRTA